MILPLPPSLIFFQSDIRMSPEFAPEFAPHFAVGIFFQDSYTLTFTKLEAYAQIEFKYNF